MKVQKVRQKLMKEASLINIVQFLLVYSTVLQYIVGWISYLVLSIVQNRNLTLTILKLNLKYLLVYKIYINCRYYVSINYAK